MTTYLRLFIVNTLDLVLYTYELCYSNCFYYKQPEHYIRRTNSNELELGTYGSPINIASQPININIQNIPIETIETETIETIETETIETIETIETETEKSTDTEQFIPEVIEMNKQKSPNTYEWDILEESFST